MVSKAYGGFSENKILLIYTILCLNNYKKTFVEK